MNAKQNAICAIAALALFFTVGKACLQAMALGWGFNRRFFVGIMVIVSGALVALVLARDKN